MDTTAAAMVGAGLAAIGAGLAAGGCGRFASSAFAVAEPVGFDPPGSNGTGQ